VKGRHRRNPGPLSDFIRNEGHGIAKIIAFNLQWLDAAERLPCCRMIAYEDIHVDPVGRLINCAAYFGQSVPLEDAQAVTEHRAFSNMQEQERRGELLRKSGQPVKTTDPSDLSKYKVRRGVIGGYRDEFTSDDLAWSEELLRATGYEERLRQALDRWNVRTWHDG
jgi:hypothetical protein